MRGEGRGYIDLVVAFNLSEAVSAYNASSRRIMVELLIMSHFYMRGEGGRGGGDDGEGKKEGVKVKGGGVRVKGAGVRGKGIYM